MDSKRVLRCIELQPCDPAHERWHTADDDTVAAAIASTLGSKTKVTVRHVNIAQRFMWAEAVREWWNSGTHQFYINHKVKPETITSACELYKSYSQSVTQDKSYDAAAWRIGTVKRQLPVTPSQPLPVSPALANGQQHLHFPAALLSSQPKQASSCSGIAELTPRPPQGVLDVLQDMYDSAAPKGKKSLALTTAEENVIIPYLVKLKSARISVSMTSSLVQTRHQRYTAEVDRYTLEHVDQWRRQRPSVKDVCFYRDITWLGYQFSNLASTLKRMAERIKIDDDEPATKRQNIITPIHTQSYLSSSRSCT
jgi:hypothetical protein